MPHKDAESYVDLLYRHLLQRPADPDGLRHFAGRLQSGDRLESVIDALLGSDEYRQKSVPAPPPVAYKPLQTRPITIVDLGAQSLSDEAHVYAPLLETGLDWRCYGFEPQKDRLDERLSREGDSRLSMIDAFVGDGKEHVFALNSDSGSSSLLALNTAFNSSFDDICRIRTIDREQVRTRRLDDVLPEMTVDFLKLDIQGFELAALQGALHVLQRTNVVHCEVFFGPMYERSPFFSEIELFLRSNGFAFIDFSHLNRYEYVDVPRRTGQRDRLIWGDAVFFRTLEPGQASRADRVAQSMVASLVYQKHGLAQHLLAEQD